MRVNLVCALTLLSAVKANDVVRIMPLGDSITAGYMGEGMEQCCHAAINATRTAAALPEDYSCCLGGGYRRCLGELLKGYSSPATPSFDFVGSRYHLGDHQGHSGARIVRVLEELQQTRSLELYVPDIILLLAGTNDFGLRKDEGGGDPVIEAQGNMSVLLEYLVAKTVPTAQIVVSTITRLGNGSTTALARPGMQEGIDKYNTLLPDFLSHHNHTGKLSLVQMDANAGFVQPDQAPPHGDYWYNGVHFNGSGWAKMAGVWKTAIDEVLPRVLVKDREQRPPQQQSHYHLREGSRIASKGVSGENAGNDYDDGGDGASVAAPRLLPLGDSLTLGVQGEGNPATCNVTNQNGCLGGGYRSLLGTLLKPKADVGSYHQHVDFVGDLSLFGDHQGHSGATFGGILDNLKAKQTMQVYTPKYVLVLGGTNDFYQNHTVADALADAARLLNYITESAAAPDMHVLWSTTPLVIPSRCTRSTHPVRVFQCPVNMNDNIRQLNSKLPALLAEHKMAVLVNMSNAGFVEDDYWIGGVHFNTSGWDKMANAWYSVLQPLL